MIEIVELCVADPPAAWAAAGFAVRDGTCSVGTVRIAFRGDGGGLTGWRVRGVAPIDTIDGIPTETVDAALAPPERHPNGVESIDHIVIMTSDCDRTVAAFRALGEEPRRERIGGSARRPVRQVFVRAGEVILEIVGPVESSPDALDAPVASMWGLAYNVADLDASAEFLGPAGCGTARDAVQDGRRIATLRHAHFGMSVPTVLMSANSGRAGQSSASTAGA